MITHLTETARALRALFLNIVGDTKTEIEEGVTWTTGEIAGLQDVIKTYAKDAYDAAQATGSIIDPMKAMEGLSKSLKDGLLTEQQLMEMVSDIGGKLRTSQLLALINNWDMYESMLNDYRNAYGSADKEIENAMDSWTRKTNVLKNTWTQFVKTGLDSSFFKGFLDTMTEIVKGLDSAPGVLTRIALAIAGLRMPHILSSLGKAKDYILNIGQNLGTLKGNISALGLALTGLSVIWSGISFAVQKHKQAVEEARQALYKEAEEAKASSKNILDLNVALEGATVGSDDFNSSAKSLAETLGISIPEGADAAIKKLREFSSERLRAAVGTTNTAMLEAQDNLVSSHSTPLDLMYGAPIMEGAFYGGTTLGNRLQSIYGGLPMDGNGNVKLGNLNDILAFRDAMQEVVSAYNDYILETGNAELKNDEFFQSARQYLSETAELFDTYDAKKKDALDTKAAYEFQKAIRDVSVESQKDLNSLIGTIINSTEYTSEEKDAMIALANEYYHFGDAAEKVTEAVKSETSALNANQKALDANASAADRAAAAKKDAEAAVRQFIPALISETGELTENARAAFAASSYLADLAAAELSARNEAAQANYAALRAELAGVSTQALRAASAIMAMEAAYISGETSGIDMHLIRRYNNVSGAARAADILRQMADLESQINSINVSTAAVAPYTSSYKPSTGGGSSGGSSGGRTSGGSSSSSSSGASQVDQRRLDLENRVKLLKSELSLMQERGDSVEDQIAKMREIQDALNKEADYYRSIGEDQATINGLSQEWWSYHNKIESLMQQEAEDAEKQAKAIQDAVDAQRALDNALDQRNVRIYNAQTGQWEWSANPSNVQSAREALNNALSGFSASDMAAFQSALASSMAADNLGNINSIIQNAAFNRGDWTPISGVPRGGVNNYGNTYTFGNVTLTESQAKSMSVYELAQLSGRLGIYQNGV